MSSLSADSFEKLGLHTHVCVALSAKGIKVPYPQQAAALAHTTRDLCDVLATVQPHTGRHTLLIAFAAHCVLSASVPKFAVIVASSNSAATKLNNVTRMFGIMGITPFLVLDGADKSRTSGCVTPSVVITTLPTIMKWGREDLIKCASLLIDDTAVWPTKDLERVMSTLSSASDAANMFMLSTLAPCDVPSSIRYGLNRRRRRFASASPCSPAFSFLLATDHEDRLKLLHKLVQLKSLRRILVLTHSKEVKDIRMKLQQWGLDTFALGRNAALSEQASTISEFISRNYGVLVTSDAYAGVDLLDVDGVIQYYPPQKSMDEDEWADFVRCIRTTSHTRVPTRFITLLGTDDFTLGAYFMKRAECDGVVLNITPTHPRFGDVVLNPLPAVQERISQPLPSSIEFPQSAPSNATAGSQQSGKQQQGGNNGGAINGKKGTAATAPADNGKKGAAAAPQLTAKQIQKEKEAQKAKEKQQQKAKADEKGAAKGATPTTATTPVVATPTSGTSNGSPASLQGGADGDATPLSNRAKRRLAQEELRLKQEAAAKAKEEARAREREREANRLKEKERQREKEAAKKAAATAAASPKPPVSPTVESPGTPTSATGLSKRQQRREEYHAESKQRPLPSVASLSPPVTSPTTASPPKEE